VASEAETILVVDDQEIVLKTVCTILERAGYNILRAMSGPEALALCQNHHGLIHLALLDVIMPGLNGPALSECLRGLLPTVRILYMSGYTHAEIVSRGVQADIGDYVAKPFTATSLLHRVREALAPTGSEHGKAG
jgi:two-component system cell cycle sensor histidine kinase/response regulator CckA